MTQASVKAFAVRAGQRAILAPDWLLERLARVSTTNLRVAVTLGLAIGTALRYWTASDGWEPSVEWVGLIFGLSGADVVQWTQKRRTQWRSHSGNGPPQNGHTEGSERADEF